MAQQRDTDLNEPQQRRLTVTCRHLDELLSELEHSIQEAHSESAFRRFEADLAPAEEQLFRAYVRRLRSQLVRILDEEGLSPHPEPIGLRKSLLTGLIFFDIAVTELEPRYMASYGEVAPPATTALNALTAELHRTIQQLHAYLVEDPLQRLAPQLQQAGAEGERFKVLQALVEKYGLVEFRGALTAAGATLGREGLELAIFGRVNTGKSTLLNRLIGADVLPVGVTPITSVPTRIRFGASVKLLVTCAGGPTQETELSRLVEYASAEFNAGNRKRVVGLVAEIPAPLLASGVTLVDTPGLASTDEAGELETLAYLPNCDAAAVLVEAAATLTPGDVRTIQALLQAGARVSVLLSKADQLSDADRLVVQRYVGAVLNSEFRQVIDVIAVSTIGQHRWLLEAWRTQYLMPMLERQRGEHRDTCARKLDILASHVAARLRAMSMATASPVEQQRSREAASQLRKAEALLLEREQASSARVDSLALATTQVLERAILLQQSETDPVRALAAAFREITGEAAAEIRSELVQLATDLREVREQISHSMEWRSTERLGIAVDAVTAVPRPEDPWNRERDRSAEQPLKLSSLLFAIRRNRLKRAAVDRVTAGLRDYSAVLRHWMLEQLTRLRRQWGSDTEALRAEIDRRLGYAPQEGAALDDIRSDLESLDGSRKASSVLSEHN